MRTYTLVVASALLLAALTVGLSSKLPGGNFTLLLIVFLALVVNGLFSARLAGHGAKRGRAQSKRRRSKGGPKAPRTHTEVADERSEDSQREEGTIKWFDETKGFGFIIRDAGGEIFVHKRSVKAANGERPQLPDGCRVSFQVAENEKGPYAKSVTTL